MAAENNRSPYRPNNEPTLSDPYKLYAGGVRERREQTVVIPQFAGIAVLALLALLALGLAWLGERWLSAIVALGDLLIGAGLARARGNSHAKITQKHDRQPAQPRIEFGGSDSSGATQG